MGLQDDLFLCLFYLYCEEVLTVTFHIDIKLYKQYVFFSVKVTILCSLNNG